MVIYTSVDQVFSEPVFRSCGERTGLEVRAVFDTEETKSTGVLNRLLAESAHPQADVFWSGDPVRPFVLADRGLVEQYVSRDAATIPSEFRSADGLWTGLAARARVLLVNADLVVPADEPTSVRDLADPRWRGRTAIANPIYGTTTMHAAALFDIWGDAAAQEFFESLRSNEVRVAASNGEVKRLVTAGEVAFGLTDTDDARQALLDGHRVRVVYPDQSGMGTLVMPTSVVLLQERSAPGAGAPTGRLPARGGDRALVGGRRCTHADSRRNRSSRRCRERRLPARDAGRLRVGGSDPGAHPAVASPLGWRVAAGARDLQRTLTLGLTGLVVIAAAGLPIVGMVAGLPAWGIRPEIEPARLVVLLLRSVGLACIVTAIGLLLGVPLGLLFGVTDLKGRRLLWVLHTFPVFLPPFLLALGWIHWFGRRGIVGSDGTADVLFSDVGLVLVSSLALAPIATGLTGTAARNVDSSLIEAGRTVAAPTLVLRHVLLPSVMPAAALAGILIFALAFGEIGVPMLLRRDVYPAAALSRLGAIDYAPGEAAALCLPLVPLALALLAIERRFAGRRTFALLGLRGNRGPALPLGSLRGPLSLVAALVSALGLAPIAALAWRAFSGGGFVEMSSWIGTSVRNSLVVAGATAAIATGLGVVVGHSFVLGRRSAKLLDALLFLDFLLPAAVLGTGMIQLWNRPGTQWLYTSAGILIVAATARYTVAASRASAVTFANAQPHWEDAARVAGARYLRRLLPIVVPAGRRGVVVAAALAFILTLRDLETPVLFYPPGWAPLTVRIVTLEANGPESVVAALAMVQIALTCAALGVAALSLRRTR